MKKIYVLDAFESSGLRYLDENSKYECVHFKGDILDWHEDAVGIMIRGRQISAKDIEKARNLEVISKQGVGVDNIDLEAARRHSITVCNTPGINSNAVAELAFSLALSVSRRIAQFDRLIRAGEKINRPDYLGMELREKAVGVIGMGNIGRHAAEYFHRAFNCKILAYDPYASPETWSHIPHERVRTLSDLLPNVSLVTLHVPLTDETRHIIDKKAIKAMKPGTIVINVSRGGLIDEVALHDALVSGHIFGAGLDAFEEGEPPGRSNPLVLLPNVVSTPHAGAGTNETQMRSSTKAAQQLIAVLNGLPPEHKVV